MFDIEPVTLVLSLVIIALITSPFVIYKRKQSHKIKAQKLFMEQMESGSNLKFDHADSWRDLYYIGLDTGKKALVYVKFEPEKTAHQIDLSWATDIQLVKIERAVEIDGKPANVIDRLSLKIEISNEKKGAKILEFYDCDQFSDNMGEWPLIQKWEKLLKPIVKSNQIHHKKGVLN
ncbi:hypothetical protein [Cognataquiflexum rubidum]|uniref:hypothetical protein n=1 Tax=Cognataquiflexum rubidum TaxID=2922273 RepID=UPI001F134E29|nr:hypothetical protein [Cognataquiflexum rubidum]MCH6235164.1 hypothetical protein [Cognataquiflexum rubidum]